MSTTLSEAKARFARLIASTPRVDDARVCDAFGKVPREQFVGPGPWLLLEGNDYTESHGSDPALLYADVVVALMPTKRINNGQPTLHALCLSAARIRPGERILHIGCGSGYYSAILSELAMSSGDVLAWDIEPEMVAAAKANLEGRPNAKVALRDATTAPIPARDVVYVCAGCTRPIRSWAEALSDGGRLLFPLTPGWDFGGVLLVTRRGAAFGATFISRCSFIPCVGGSDPSEESPARSAFSRGSAKDVQSINFGTPPAGDEVWLAGHDWWLSTKPPLH